MDARTLAFALVSLAGIAACSDPVRSREIDALGGETPGIPPGPLHRAGQPCVLCHGGSGPGGSVFSFAGTVYQDQTKTAPAPDVFVHMVDAKNRSYRAATNCVGNFFIMRADYNPEFPVWTRLQFGQSMGMPLPEVEMGSPIYREGSCATCHTDPASVDSTDHVYLSKMPLNIPTGCP